MNIKRHSMDITIPHVTQAASWGPNDPEVENVWVLFKEAIRLIEDKSTADEADFWADRIYEKLGLARNHYIAINKSGFTKRSTSEQDGEYDALYAALWSAYKDRLPKMISMIGYDISFIFAGEKQFKSQATAFKQQHPEHEWLVNYADTQRVNWQNGLRDHRNARQHDGDLREMPNATDINNPKFAKHLFIQVCNTIEGVGVSLLSYKLPPQWTIVTVNADANVFGRVTRYEIRHAATLR